MAHKLHVGKQSATLHHGSQCDLRYLLSFTLFTLSSCRLYSYLRSHPSPPEAGYVSLPCGFCGVKTQILKPIVVFPPHLKRNIVVPERQKFTSSSCLTVKLLAIMFSQTYHYNGSHSDISRSYPSLPWLPL